MAIRKISLDTDEIKKAITDLKNLKKNIEKKTDTAIEEVMTDAVKYCQSLTPISDNQGNHLRFNTYWEKTTKGYRLVQEGDHIAYVEFGTGVIGKSSPHVEAGKFGWQYGVGSHIFETKDGKTGWFFPTGEIYTSVKTGVSSQKYKFTQGQPANMQVYKTGLWLEEKLGVKVNYVVDGELSKW